MKSVHSAKKTIDNTTAFENNLSDGSDVPGTQILLGKILQLWEVEGVLFPPTKRVFMTVYVLLLQVLLLFNCDINT